MLLVAKVERTPMAVNLVSNEPNFSGKVFRAVIARMVDFVDVAHVFPETVCLFHVLVTDWTLELWVLTIRVSPRVFGECPFRFEALAALFTDVLTERLVVVHFGVVVSKRKYQTTRLYVPTNFGF